MSNCFLYDKCNHVDCESPFCLRKYKTYHLLKNACLEPAQMEPIKFKVDADNTDLAEFKTLGNIANNIGEFVEKGGNLYIYSSNCGNGKTSWAITLLRAYIQSIWAEAELTCKALFINVPRYLISMKDKISGGGDADYATYIQNNIESADLIVWDDIAAKVGSEYELNQLLSRMEIRFCARKANIFTSNTDVKDLGNALGERLASRIAGNSIKIELHGADKRFLGMIDLEVK